MHCLLSFIFVTCFILWPLSPVDGDDDGDDDDSEHPMNYETSLLSKVFPIIDCHTFHQTKFHFRLFHFYCVFEIVIDQI